jgi:hypothetical protein
MLRSVIICLLGVIPCFANALENGFDIFASYDAAGKVVLVSWTNKEANAHEFILQKSDDQENWMNVDTLFNMGELDQQMILWEDRNPVPGGYLYRLKAMADEANFSYSKPVYVKISPSLFEWAALTDIKKEKLTLQYAGKATINGVINIILQTRSGLILYRSRFSSFTTMVDIPVNNLGTGNYYVNIFVEGELIWHYRYQR